MKELLKRFYDFLVANDFDTLLLAAGKLDWSQVAKSAYTWLIVIPLLIFLLWTKKFKTLIAIVSSCAFILLIEKTLSHTSGTLALNDLMIFLAGAIALIGLNIYVLFVRG